MFDYNWRFASALSHEGDAEIRANGRALKRPDRNLKIDPKVVDSYVGRYQIQDGPVVEIYKEGEKLLARGTGRLSELIPESETTWFVTMVNVRVFFERDASGKVTGFTGWDNRDFEVKKLE